MTSGAIIRMALGIKLVKNLTSFSLSKTLTILLMKANGRKALAAMLASLEVAIVLTQCAYEAAKQPVLMRGTKKTAISAV